MTASMYSCWPLALSKPNTKMPSMPLLRRAGLSLGIRRVGLGNGVGVCVVGMGGHSLRIWMGFFVTLSIATTPSSTYRPCSE